MENLKISTESKLLAKSLKGLKIELVLFDIDDTLIDTHSLFTRGVRSYVNKVSKVIGTTPENLLKEFPKFNSKAHAIAQVQMHRWLVVSTIIAKNYGVKNELLAKFAEELIQLIYFDEYPKIFPNTLRTLNTFSEAKIPIGAVTHADLGWTERKMKHTGLNTFFKKDNLFIADSKVPKGPEIWSHAILKMGGTPEKSLVIGDNVIGDIVSARQVGVKNTISLPSPFHIYAQGEVPTESLKCSNIGQIVELLISRAFDK
ncbi:HAD family hydrolase [bacterium]|nr:HAD family hydrolase [bacterium]